MLLRNTQTEEYDTIIDVMSTSMLYTYILLNVVPNWRNWWWG